MTARAAVQHLVTMAQQDPRVGGKRAGAPGDQRKGVPGWRGPAAPAVARAPARAAALAALCLLGAGPRAQGDTLAPAGGTSPPAPAAPPALQADFTSYGRVIVGLDLRGHTGYQANVVSFGPRTLKPTYIEGGPVLTGSIGREGSRRWRLVVTAAMLGDLINFTGKLSQNLALRNAYLETEDLLLPGLSLWAGSRAYRGDGSFLLDFWPLDCLNLVGAGADYRLPGRPTQLQLRLGVSRLSESSQLQVLAPAWRTEDSFTEPSFSAPAATVLDRPRLVVAAKLVHRLRGPGLAGRATLSLYGELHHLPEGEGTGDLGAQPLPSDLGWVVGGEIDLPFAAASFARLWVRHGGGLAAYYSGIGDLLRPYGYSPDGRVAGASDLLVTAGGNWEITRWLGLAFDANYHRFRAASGTGVDDAVAAVRGTAYATRHLHLALDASYQFRRWTPEDLAPNNQQLLHLGLLPIVAPLGRGTFSRPFLYVVYMLSVLSDSARRGLWDARDLRAPLQLSHFLGTGIEWWLPPGGLP